MRLIKVKLILSTASTTLAALLSLPAFAQPASTQNYPSKPVRVVVGFPAGGPADTMARMVGKKLSEQNGQSVIIENRPGANSFLAGEYVARSAPDGYTSWFASGSILSFSKQLYSKPLVDPDRDFALVVQAVSVPEVFVIHPSLPVKNMQELAQFATRRPAQLNISIITPGGIIHLGVEQFKLAAGIKMTNVQYKGAAPALVDIVGGHIEAALFDAPAIIGYLPSGKLRALAVASGERIKQMPQVPTTTEAGFPGVRVEGWYGIAVPASTPPDLIQRMNRQWNAAVRSPDTQALLTGIGAVPVGGSAEEFQAFRTAEGRKWGDLIRKIGLKLE